MDAIPMPDDDRFAPDSACADDRDIHPARTLARRRRLPALGSICALYVGPFVNPLIRPMITRAVVRRKCHGDNLYKKGQTSATAQASFILAIQGGATQSVTGFSIFRLHFFHWIARALRGPPLEAGLDP